MTEQTREDPNNPIPDDERAGWWDQPWWFDEVRAAGRCWYCGTKHGPILVEHVTPKNRGGTNRRTNLVPACRSCNTTKGPQTLDEYREDRKEINGRQVVFFGETEEGAHLAPQLAPDPLPTRSAEQEAERLRNHPSHLLSALFS